jgi:hypothetical protein
MRDPARIDRILGLLEDIWRLPGCTDLRLGQMLVKATGHTRDMFYLEDDRIESSLRHLRQDLLDRGLPVSA